jgi:hypothetical protein
VVVAQALRSNARRVDVVARYGSDEFVDLMPRTSLGGGRHFFERVRAEVTERSMLVLGFPMRLSAGADRLHHDDAGDSPTFFGDHGPSDVCGEAAREESLGYRRGCLPCRGRAERSSAGVTRASW